MSNDFWAISKIMISYFQFYKDINFAMSSEHYFSILQRHCFCSFFLSWILHWFCNEFWVRSFIIFFFILKLDFKIIIVDRTSSTPIDPRVSSQPLLKRSIRYFPRVISLIKWFMTLLNYRREAERDLKSLLAIIW